MQSFEKFKKIIELEKDIASRLQEIGILEREMMKLLVHLGLEVDDPIVKEDFFRIAKLRTFFQQYHQLVQQPALKILEKFENEVMPLALLKDEFDYSRQLKLEDLEEIRKTKLEQLKRNIETKRKSLKNRIHQLMNESNRQALEVAKAQKEVEESMKTGLAKLVFKKTQNLRVKQQILTQIQSNLERALQKEQVLDMEYQAGEEALNDWYIHEIEQLKKSEHTTEKQLMDSLHAILQQVRAIYLTEITHLSNKSLANFLDQNNLTEIYFLLDKESLFQITSVDPQQEKEIKKIFDWIEDEK